MSVFLSPVLNETQLKSDGTLASAYKIYTYAEGSSTLLTTYTTSAGSVAQANPIILNSRGEVDDPIWLTGGLGYKFVMKTDADVTINTIDNVKGVNDTTTTVDQWVSSGLTPTYVSATQFTLVGDQTTAFHVGRELKSTVTAGTTFSEISVSAYTSLTTITVVNDSGTLDSGLSAVSYGLLTNTNPSLPAIAARAGPLAASGITGAAASGANSDITSLTGLTTALTTPQGGTGSKTGAILRGYLAGLKLSTAGASATMSIAAGQASDSTNADLLTLAAIAKTTSAWSVGTAAGGIDTGAIANATWYHFYVIRRPDTGVVDVTFSTNATTPTLAANYTQYRRIGSGLTNGSAQWTSFVQDGGLFQWLVPIADIGATNPGTSAVSATLTVPLGVRVKAWVSAYVKNGTTNNITLYLSDLATTDNTPATPAFYSLITDGQAADKYTSADFQIMTNTSSAIRYRLSASGAADVVGISTKGWYDSLGKDS